MAATSSIIAHPLSRSGPSLSRGAGAARPPPLLLGARRPHRRLSTPPPAALRRSSGNRYRELVERDVLPDGSPNTPARRLSAALREASSLRALRALVTRTAGRQSSAWEPRKHAPLAVMRATSLQVFAMQLIAAQR